jgi:hypothetical protein
MPAVLRMSLIKRGALFLGCVARAAWVGNPALLCGRRVRATAAEVVVSACTMEQHFTVCPLVTPEEIELHEDCTVCQVDELDSFAEEC